MKNRIIASLMVFQVVCIINSNHLNDQSYVTYEIPSGRLGDKLLTYIHAKWISYKYGLTLLYKPFEYSDKLMLSELEVPYDRALGMDLIRVNKLDNPDYINTKKVIFEIPFFPESNKELKPMDNYYYFDIDWKDSEFKSLLQKALSPKIKLEVIKPPKDCITLAVHVRKNSGGYDLPLSYEVIEKLGYLPEGKYTDFEFPLKHPSDDYYIEQIKRASEFFNNQKIYIFIFTDDPTPARIAKQYEEILKDHKNITIDYRKTENKHNLNVLEDLFSIMEFDALIRSDSNLTIIATLVGNFKLVISPKGYKKIGHKIIIDQVDLQIPGLG